MDNPTALLLIDDFIHHGMKRREAEEAAQTQ
jgi:hypothetical protein